MSNDASYVPTGAEDEDTALLEALGHDLFGDEEYDDAHRLETICDRDNGRAANAAAGGPLLIAAGYAVAQHVWRELPDVEALPLILTGASGLIGTFAVTYGAESTGSRLQHLMRARHDRKPGEDIDEWAGRALRRDQVRVFTKYAGATLAVALATQGLWMGGRAAVAALTPPHAVERLTR